MKPITGLVLLLILMSACQQTPDPVEPEKRFNETNTIDWANPQPGQQTWYQRYESDCDRLHRKFKWTGDTLIVEIISQDDQLYLQETLTEHSISRLEQGEPIPSLHRIEFHEDYLLLPERWASSLFFFFGNDTLPFHAAETPPVHQEGCILTLDEDEFIGNDMGQLDQFAVGPVTIEDKMAMSCVPGGIISFGLNAYLMFDSEQLYLSHTVTDGEDVRGWVRMD